MSTKMKAALSAVIVGLILGTPGIGTASATTSPSTAQSREGYPCQLFQFCAWDETGPYPPTLLYTRGGTIPCGLEIDLPGGVRNRFGSINNMTSGTWELKDGSRVVFVADENSYGNLPAVAQNNVDNLRFICT